VAFVLLIGAGLLLASFRNVLAVDPGFDAVGVETALINLPEVRYKDDPALHSFVSRLVERLRGVPGMQAVAATSTIPFAGGYSDSVIVAEGYVMKPGESVISPSQVRVTDGWFETMKIRLIAGRTFRPSDTTAAPGVVIVDERLARRFWPNADPIGRRMYLPSSGEDLVKPSEKVRWLTVVGVVGAVRLAALVSAPNDRFGTYYLPYAQDPSRTVGLAMRVGGTGRTVLDAARREIAALDPELPLFDVQAMSARIDESLVSRRVPMGLALAFGGVALLLAALGIYGVLAYQVARRRREIGIRMALGSTTPGIFRLVMGEGLRMLAVGLIVGLTGTVALGRVIQSQLYDVSPLDPAVIAWVAAGLAIVALIAAGVPARRATRIDPVTALAE
jgi:predicted permease